MIICTYISEVLKFFAYLFIYFIFLFFESESGYFCKYIFKLWISKIGFTNYLKNFTSLISSKNILIFQSVSCFTVSETVAIYVVKTPDTQF